MASPPKQDVRQLIDSLMADPDTSRVYGQPFETADGATVITVAKVRARSKPGADDSRFRFAARPIGVFVIKDGTATWQPAVDASRVAVIGVLTGLIAATLGTLAMVRRPPWPDLRGDISGWR